MVRAPLFSTYRQGENRVTASLIAVLQRIDAGLVEQLLQSASGDDTIRMVQFRNQPSGDGSTPDAEISGSFRYVFEVKTARGQLGEDQLRRHLRSLRGSHGDVRLFAITPDHEEPPSVATVTSEAVQVAWFNFPMLVQAIGGVLSGENVPGPAGVAEPASERDAYLLRELVRLFESDGLLNLPEDVVVVPARGAEGFYLSAHAYHCQVGRSFRAGIEYIGFYARKEIKPYFGRVLDRREDQEISRAAQDRLRQSHIEADHKFSRVVAAMLDQQPSREGGHWQLFLLSGPDDEQTIRLNTPIRHNGASAWTQNQRYLRTEQLRRQPKTTDDL